MPQKQSLELSYFLGALSAWVKALGRFSFSEDDVLKLSIEFIEHEICFILSVLTDESQ